MSVKNRLKEILTERGIKQNWLAEQVKVDKSTIGNIIKNRFNTSLEVAFKIANVLNLNVDDVFYYEEENIQEK